MPVASIEPKDALKVWDCRALQRKGSTEVRKSSLGFQRVPVFA